MEPHRIKTREDISEKITEIYRAKEKEQISNGSMTYENRIGFWKGLNQLLWNNATSSDAVDAWSQIQQHEEDCAAARQRAEDDLSSARAQREKNENETDNFTKIGRIVLVLFVLWFIACIFVRETLLPSSKFFLRTFYVFNNNKLIGFLLLLFILGHIFKRLSWGPAKKEED